MRFEANIRKLWNIFGQQAN